MVSFDLFERGRLGNSSARPGISMKRPEKHSSWVNMGSSCVFSLSHDDLDSVPECPGPRVLTMTLIRAQSHTALAASVSHGSACGPCGSGSRPGLVNTRRKTHSIRHVVRVVGRPRPLFLAEGAGDQTVFPTGPPAAEDQLSRRLTCPGRLSPSTFLWPPGTPRRRGRTCNTENHFFRLGFQCPVGPGRIGP